MKNKINMSKSRKWNKGVSLIEVVVTLAITSLVILTVVFAMQSTLSTYTRASEYSQQNIIHSAIKEFISDELRYSRKVVIGGTKPDESYYTMSIINGMLSIDGKMFPYGSDFYNENVLGQTSDLDPIFEKVDSYTLGVNFSVTSPNENKKEELTVINLLNLETTRTSIVSVEGNDGSVIHYQKF